MQPLLPIEARFFGDNSYEEHAISGERCAPPPLQAAAVAARGKKAKSKKAAEKYGAQDEEDRLLAMAILGSAGAAPKPHPHPETPNP